MKKKILIDATCNDSWIGGLYYKKNIVFSLISNNWIKEKCKITVVTDKENEYLFNIFKGKIRIKTLKYTDTNSKKIKLMIYSFFHGINYIFPSIGERACKNINAIGINWIPDFQHKHLPDNFTTSQLESRDTSFSLYYDSKNPLVLSSNDAKNDLNNYWGEKKKNVYVVPFVSYIEDEINFSDKYVERICGKYNVKKNRYIMIANQFWKHKNHIVVLKAIEKIVNNGLWNDELKFVFTGNINENQTDDYSNIIRFLLKKDEIKEVTTCLGFIDRKEQLALMKGARFLIQPSLFEGWGTVLEDAKVLDKMVLLSDIPIHREQMNMNCVLFNPHDSDELATMIIDSTNKNRIENVEKGLSEMRNNAKKYSEQFERLLKEN